GPLLVGGDGSDLLIGARGRDLLVGGFAAEQAGPAAEETYSGAVIASPANQAGHATGLPSPDSRGEREGTGARLLAAVVSHDQADQTAWDVLFSEFGKGAVPPW